MPDDRDAVLQGAVEAALDVLEDWFEEERSQTPGFINIISAGFAVSEAFREAFPVERSGYVTEGNQIKMTRARFKQIVQKALGKEAVLRFPSEGGRTTRSTPAIAERLARRLNGRPEFFRELGFCGRADVADKMERWLARRYKEYQDSRGLEIEVPGGQQPLPAAVSAVLAEAERIGKAGAVAHHLVGAKLALAFRGRQEVECRPHTAADASADKPGDYLVGEIVFHVTVAPQPLLFEKCAVNIRSGFRVWVLVPEKRLGAAREMAEQAGVGGRIALCSIEGFVGQNLEELGEFRSDGVLNVFKELVNEYNRRVSATEADPSLQMRFAGERRRG